MRFHVLGLPHTVSSKEFNACAYTQKVVKFCKMMSARGHYIIHYGHEDSDVICNEQVSVITNKDWKIAYGDYDWRKNFFKFDVEDYAYKTFFKNAIKEVGKRKKPLDFILPFWGSGVRPICDAHSDMICVEPGIGYAGGHWARWKIFESYAIYHAYCELKNVSNCNQDWYEVVIPNYFDLEDFDYSKEKDDYFLFLGRVYDGKGINAAVQMTEKIGAKLIVAGQNPDNMTFPKHVEYVGYADVETRRRLLSRAKGLIIASMYIEPFGGVQVEALLSGTPTITTDWGAFTENNINGVTGYRCRTFEDFVNAGKNIDKIKPSDCRKFAEKFSLENVALMYEKYFQDVLNVYTNKGWYHIENDVIDYDQIESEEKPFADRLATWIKENINPKKVVDIGCGPGTYVYSLRDNGINAYGYDIDDRVDGKDYLKKLSLFEINDKSDVVICLEVAEHIETSLSDSIVDSIIRNVNDDGMIIWTAAIPGQGGVGHINCQTKEYWEEKFISRGFHRDCAIESNLLEYIRSGPYMGWFLQNLMIFKNVCDKIESKKKLFDEDMRQVKIHTVNQPDSDTTTFVLSCNRLDILSKTLQSFYDTQDYPTKMVIVDDSAEPGVYEKLVKEYGNLCDVICFSRNRSQWWAMDFMVSYCDSEYIFYLEDDWELLKPGYLNQSKQILQKYREIGVVDTSWRTFEWQGIDSYEKDLVDNMFYWKKPWKITDKHLAWYSWCGSPNLKRRDDLIMLGRVEKWYNESNIDRKFASLGFKGVYLNGEYSRHLGDTCSRMVNKRPDGSKIPYNFYPKEILVNRRAPYINYEEMDHIYDYPDDVTLVTMCIDIGRRDRSFEDYYLKGLDYLLEVRNPLVIYANNKYHEYIKTRRKELSIGTSDNVVECRSLTLQDIKDNTPFDEIQNIINNNNWINQSDWMKDSVLIDPYYIPLTLIKNKLLQNIAEENIFNSKRFYWIDSGISNSFAITESIKTWNFLFLPKDKFFITSFPYQTNREIHGCNINTMIGMVGIKPTYVCRSTLFGGSKNQIIEFNNKYYDLIRVTLNQGTIGTEEAIYTMVEMMNPDLIDRYAMPNGDIKNYLNTIRNRNNKKNY